MAQIESGEGTLVSLDREGGKDNNYVSELIAPTFGEERSGVGMEGMGNC